MDWQDGVDSAQFNVYNADIDGNDNHLVRRYNHCMLHYFQVGITANTVGSINDEVQVEILKSCTDMHALL